MITSGKYYLPIITADPTNPQITESTDIGFFLMKDCFNRDNLYISGLGGKSFLQGPNLIWSNTKLNKIEYSAPGKESITGTYTCPTGAIILAEDSYISGSSYSMIVGGFRNLITRTRPYASGEIPDTTNAIINSIYSQTYDADHCGIYNCYNSMALSASGCSIINSSGSTIDAGNTNSVLINATNKYLEGGRQGIVLISDGEESAQLYNDSRTINLLFANGIRLFPRINISTDPAYDYINVKGSLDARVSSSGLYHCVLSGNSGALGTPVIREWDISHFYTVPNKFSDITIGIGNTTPIYYDVTGMSPSWGNNTAFRHLTENVLVGNDNIGKNQSLIFGNGNQVVSNNITARAELSILNKEAKLNPADKQVGIFGFENWVSGSDTFVFGQKNLVVGGLNNNLLLGVRNVILQQSGEYSYNSDGSIGYEPGVECAPQARESMLFGYNNIEKIGIRTTIIGANNYSSMVASTIIGEQNQSSGTFNLIFGGRNMVSEPENTTIGWNNQVFGEQSLVVGSNNNLATYSYAFLPSGRTSDFAKDNIIVGSKNEIAASLSTILGRHNSIVHSAVNTGDEQGMLTAKHPIKNFIVGDNNGVDGEDNFVVGSESWLVSTGTVALGKSQLVSKGNNNLMFGLSNEIYNASDVIVIGQGIRATKSNSLVLGNTARSVNSNEVVISTGPFFNRSLAQTSQLSWKGVTTGNYLKSIYLNAKEINLTTNDLDGIAIVPTGSLLNGTLNLLAASDKYTSDGKFAARKYNITLENNGNGGVKINNLSLINSYNAGNTSSWGIGLTGYGPTGVLMVVSGTANDNIYWHIVGEFNQITPTRFISGLEKYLDVPQGVGLDSSLSFNKLVKL